MDIQTPFQFREVLSTFADSLAYALYTLPVLVLVAHIVPYIFDPNGLRRYPGPILARLTDGWLSCVAFQNRWSDTVERLHQIHGSFVRIAPNHISIADPAALQAIYGHASGTLKAPFYDVFANFRTRNIFNTRERAEHARKRRIESHMFAPQSVRELESTSRVHLAELTRQWDGLCEYTARKTIEGAAGKVGSCEWEARDGRVWFNCMPWFSYWSFDTIGDLALGAPFGMLSAAKDTVQTTKHTKAGMEAIARASAGHAQGTHSHETEDMQVIEVLSARVEEVICLGVLPAYWRPLVGRFLRHRSGLGYETAPKLAGLAVAAVARRLANPDPREDMLRRLLEARDDEGKPLGPEELSAEAFALIIAGADTTANASCAAMYYIARDRRVQAKLQAELDEALNFVEDSVAPYERVKDLPYLDAVVNETLRLHTVIGVGLPRSVPAGGMTILGQHFKGGTWVSVPSYTLHRSAAIWGGNACEFYPERWIEADAEARKEMLQAFVPFSLGARSCIGRSLAVMQLHLVVATLFRRYSVVLQSDAPLEVHDGFVRKPRKCMVGLKRRSM